MNQPISAQKRPSISADSATHTTPSIAAGMTAVAHADSATVKTAVATTTGVPLAATASFSVTNTEPTTIAVIGALDEEVALIEQALSDVTYLDKASLHVICGTLSTNTNQQLRVVATVGGMGLVNAAATTQCLIDHYSPSAVMFTGIAGALNPKLHTHDIVLGKTLHYLDTDMRLIGQWKPFANEFHADSYLLSLAQRVLDEQGLTWYEGTIASGNYFVDKPEQVTAIVERTGADAVEMEGAAVCHVAARNDVPALVIRAMSDSADTDYEEFRTFDISEYANTAAILTLALLRAYGE